MSWRRRGDRLEVFSDRMTSHRRDRQAKRPDPTGMRVRGALAFPRGLPSCVVAFETDRPA